MFLGYAPSNWLGSKQEDSPLRRSARQVHAGRARADHTCQKGYDLDPRCSAAALDRPHVSIGEPNSTGLRITKGVPANNALMLEVVDTAKPFRPDLGNGQDAADATEQPPRAVGAPGVNSRVQAHPVIAGQRHLGISPLRVDRIDYVRVLMPSG